MNLIEIFKPGKYRAMNGQDYNFTEADLQATAAAYDPALYQAPFVIGHPKTDDPAYGWGKSLLFSEKRLKVEPEQVDPEFAEMVNAGRFKTVSASLYPPDHPSNPKPGVYYLRHIGFLGAQPPAVKGLKAVNFAATEEGVIEFGDWNDRTIARMFRSLKNFLISQFGQEKADTVLNEWDIEEVTADAMRPEMDETNSDAAICCAEKETEMNKIAELETQLAEANRQIASFKEQATAKDGQIATLTTEISGLKAEKRKTEFTAFCESLPTKISPAMRPTIINMMLKLDGAAPIEFGEGDNKTTKTPLEIYQEELKAAPDVVAFGEHATKTNAGKGKETASAAEFGENVDEERLDLHNRALEFMEEKSKEGAVITYLAALEAVIKEKK